MRTLIVVDNLYVGGVASSLYNFLPYIAHKSECDLLVFDDDSIDYNRIPSNVKIIRPQKLLHILGKNQETIIKESKIYAIIRAFLTIVARVINGRVSRKILFSFVKKIHGYDLAIAYAQDDAWKSLSKGCLDYVIDRVSSIKKAVIIHCDYKNFGGYNAKQLNQYRVLDKILCVSESCGNSFKECFPDLLDKVTVCENFIDIDRVKAMSRESIEYPSDSINFVTVCRLSTVKGLYRTVNAFGNIIKKYNNFTWTIVGGGPEYKRLKDRISELNLDNNIFLVGNQNNPYKYMNNASILLITSLHEAAPMVYGESAVLQLPIITTATCSAIELVSQKGIGVVVDNNEQSIEHILCQVLNNDIDMSEYKTLPEQVNNSAIEQFTNFINDMTPKTNNG